MEVKNTLNDRKISLALQFRHSRSPRFVHLGAHQFRLAGTEHDPEARLEDSI